MKLKEDKGRLRRLYLALIEKAEAENGKHSLSDTADGYENHHISPVDWGGCDHVHNLVRLSYRQHFVAHLILCTLMDSKFNVRAANSRDYAQKRTVLILRLREIAQRADVQEKIREANKTRDNSKRAKPTKHSNKLRSVSLVGREYTCPHCGKSGGGGLLRWHFDNCKERVNSQLPESEGQV